MAERQGDATERNAWLKMSSGKVHRHTLDAQTHPHVCMERAVHNPHMCI